MSRYFLVAMVAASMFYCGSGGDTNSESDTNVSEDSTLGDNSVPDNSTDGSQPDVFPPDDNTPEYSVDSSDTNDPNATDEESEVGECKLPEPYGEGKWCPANGCTLFIVDAIACTWGCGSGPDGKSPPIKFEGAPVSFFPGVCEY